MQFIMVWVTHEYAQKYALTTVQSVARTLRMRNIKWQPYFRSYKRVHAYVAYFWPHRQMRNQKFMS